MLILGIESSCDDTAAAVLHNGHKILSSVVASQIEVHHAYGGVVPELASRQHLEAITLTVREALSKAGIQKNEIDAVAATQGPGLVGSLLVGFSFAKAFAYARGIPFVGVNHLLGHINSVFLYENPPAFPFVALLASGGHTAIYHVLSHTEFKLLGQTRDDAAGEAFDKVAKMLNLGYPGGVVIDQLATSGDIGYVKFPRIYLNKKEFDFSFSGLKTAVRRHLETNPPEGPQQTADVVAGFQEAVVDVLVFKLLAAAKKHNCVHIALVGGVAANSRLRSQLNNAAKAADRQVHFPPIELCGDNAAMVAATGYHHLKLKNHAALRDDVFARYRRP